MYESMGFIIILALYNHCDLFTFTPILSPPVVSFLPRDSSHFCFDVILMCVLISIPHVRKHILSFSLSPHWSFLSLPLLVTQTPLDLPTNLEGGWNDIHKHEQSYPEICQSRRDRMKKGKKKEKDLMDGPETNLVPTKQQGWKIMLR